MTSNVLNNAAAAVQFLTFGTAAIEGCVRGFTLLLQAREYGNEALIIRGMIELEQSRLITWARQAGLLSDPPCPRFSPENAESVWATLQLLEVLLTDLGKLRAEYGLDLKETKDEIEQLGNTDTALSRLSLRQRPQFYNDAAHVFQERTTIWHRVKWVSADKDKVHKLLERVDYFNTRLEKFLESKDQLALATGRDSLLRAAVLNTKRSGDLEAIERSVSTDPRVTATVQLRRKGLRLGVLGLLPPGPNDIAPAMPSPAASTYPPHRRSSSYTIPTARSNKLTIDRLQTTDPMETGLTRQSATYISEHVLVEWKTVYESHTAKLRYRIEGVAAFLHEMTHSSFHSLRCKGYVKEPRLDRYGYIFELPSVPPMVSTRKSSTNLPPIFPPMCTLKDLLTSVSYDISLNSRYQLALTLLETVQQLHTSGWLHKSIRSDNLIFFNRPSDLEDLDPKSISMYLAGYVWARADNPLEMTEATESQYEVDLYRHPLAGTIRESYRKTFDMYSVGCILVELGLWTPLSGLPRRLKQISRTADGPDTTSAVATRPSTASESYMQVRRIISGTLAAETHDLRRALEACAGRVFADVTMAYLTAEQSRPRSPASPRNSRDDIDEGEDEVHSFVLEMQGSCLASMRAVLDVL